MQLPSQEHAQVKRNFAAFIIIPHNFKEIQKYFLFVALHPNTYFILRRSGFELSMPKGITILYEESHLRENQTDTIIICRKVCCPKYPHRWIYLVTTHQD